MMRICGMIKADPGKSERCCGRPARPCQNISGLRRCVVPADGSLFEIAPLLDLLAADSGPGGPVWTHTSTDLNVNLLHFDAGKGVPEHVNDEVDVLIVGVAGEGVLEVNGAPHPVVAGIACVVPKGARRSL